MNVGGKGLLALAEGVSSRLLPPCYSVGVFCKRTFIPSSPMLEFVYVHWCDFPGQSAVVQTVFPLSGLLGTANHVSNLRSRL
jgi:hypothetical protein